MPVSTERRKNPRFLASPGSFVISKANPYARCSIVDIGRSGLAYCHEMESAVTSPSDQLAIMTPDGEILLNNIQCRIVSDIPAKSGIALAEADQQARCSVCFENLTLLQMERLDNFIHTHATRPLH